MTIRAKLLIVSLCLILAVVGMGGLWIAFFAWQLKDRRVLPTPAAEGHHHG